MKQWKDLTSHQVGRVGRSLVADELNRRGALATLTNTTRTRVAVVAMHPDTSRTVNILVKTKRVKVWQWNIDKAEAEQQAPEDDFLILAFLTSLTCLFSMRNQKITNKRIGCLTQNVTGRRFVVSPRMN